MRLKNTKMKYLCILVLGICISDINLIKCKTEFNALENLKNPIKTQKIQLNLL